MTIITGKDTAKTRKTLTAGGASIAYYSIPAAEAAGLGDFARLPAALKVVLAVVAGVVADVRHKIAKERQKNGCV